MLLLLDEDDDDDDDEEEEEELDMMKNSRICLRKGGDVVVTDYLTGGREDECQFSEAGFHLENRRSVLLGTAGFCP